METILIWTITAGLGVMVLDPNLGTTYTSSIGIVHGELFADEKALNKSFFILLLCYSLCVCGAGASNSKELYWSPYT